MKNRTDQKKIILIGGFLETIELCSLYGYTVIGIIDNRAVRFEGIPVIGTDKDAAALFEQYRAYPCVLTPDQPAVRERLYHYYKGIGFSFASLVSPRAFISESASIGEGCIIQSGCNVSSNTRIGKFVKLNSFANVMHDVVVGDFSTIAPNAVVLGHVTIGGKAYIGANSTVIQNHQIGENSVIGAGAVVTKDVEAGKTVAGVPARVIR